MNKIIIKYFFLYLIILNTSFLLKKKMLQEHTPSTDSLDVINDAIIRNTFLGYTESAATVEEKEKDIYCCTDNCFKWWFFHSSFQASKKSIIEENLLHKRKQLYCCDVCSECLEIKLLNYCASSEFSKEYCSDCFYNGCQLSCCCFTFILTTK